ncbi:MAG: hypothetical protein A2700_00325 [Candidatus Blackburnbacteria bacterium RIFCSPHIGHO2_01_FULL_44_64]|uniref:Polyprenyl synthetase n=1 Tax=Candidatus Blackburnbacteria bacterium RIFCSPHIGHO2_02_FULL_44_20 TaxID=1797516 RepID=A0A1G1V7D5_9BACT|nr:MAG: hypothetical protein A2700_00325 [Candidatus Blackburnbacteria bacterium RIFCSPHIGHO2_01_FULL_44_64]OGY10223.1 MAG: hypothetical protein A3E16_03370 [Candidatus Blackburnbacteria bacterium RIFCSPHIGHO2_12_FULL_44_25]OGY11364.1 MAG: hypothetical protein A3D26_02565 [Candidatus Blackburnbacteria bacterium RIFCSPHIGHO2_02_FULL_44_20]OGY13540.1 MAG: hypothetical protein A3A62_00990 [Candidatus Blackburnbacteria bacterium RIFCSPLOWO2_01_FULL_44_43]OGY16764.1 MAG: hypothetical protein A3H88_0
MNYKNYFGPYTQEQNKFLKNFFKEKVRESRKIAPSVAPQIWQQFERFIEGGKRMRGGLVRLGYESFGGKKLKEIIPVSVAMELTHISLLMMDDIADQDVLRHGKDTVHISYTKFHKKNKRKGNPIRYGESMTTFAGVTGCYEAIKLIANANFDPERKTAGIAFLSNFLINTGYGQCLDIDLASRNSLSEKDITTVNRLKTAWYTIVGPLSLGAVLTGANYDNVKIFEEYGLPLGIAFQIQDDILGMFGNEKQTGKSTASDIKEGKNTLLYLWAVKKGTPKQVRSLKKLWGKKDITKAEIKEVRDIIVNSGSLVYCQKKAEKLVKEARRIVPRLTGNKSLQEVYQTLADFVIQREK